MAISRGVSSRKFAGWVPMTGGRGGGRLVSNTPGFPALASSLGLQPLDLGRCPVRWWLLWGAAAPRCRASLAVPCPCASGRRGGGCERLSYSFLLAMDSQKTRSARQVPSEPIWAARRAQFCDMMRKVTVSSRRNAYFCYHHATKLRPPSGPAYRPGPKSCPLPTQNGGQPIRSIK